MNIPLIKLLYISNQRLPTEKAYGIQIAKMCESFGELTNAELVFPKRKNKIKQDLFDYYGVKRNFGVKIFSSPDFYWPGRFDRFAFTIKNAISAVILTFLALPFRDGIIFSRDEMPLYLLSFFKKNLIFEAHTFSGSRRFFYKRFQKANLKIITISQHIKSEFINFGYPDYNLLVAHDGVDLSQFDLNISKDEARLKKDLPVDKKIVMYTGHLFSWKGADTLAAVAKERSNLDFVFIGGTDHDINNFRNKYIHVPNLKVMGRKPHREIPLYLKSADVLVLPNSAKDKISSFTSPLKLFEYMASGRPIVASDLPSIKEVLNENNSVLFAPDDPKSLDDSIQKILNNREFAENISAEALKDVQSYTWQERSENIIHFMGHAKR